MDRAVFLSILITVSVLTASRQNLKFDAPFPKIRASRDTAVIAKGKHLVNATHDKTVSVDEL